MAVNRICYKDGKKILIPVLTRKEYFELRDSRYNFEQLEKARRGEVKAQADARADEDGEKHPKQIGTVVLLAVRRLIFLVLLFAQSGSSLS